VDLRFGIIGLGGIAERFEEDFEDGFISEIEHFVELYRAGVFDALMTQWGLR